MLHELHGFSNNQQLNNLFNSLFSLTTKEISKFHINVFTGDQKIPITKGQECKSRSMSLHHCGYGSATISDHFVYVPNQWEMMLHSNIVSHWLGAYIKWSLNNDFEIWKVHSTYDFQGIYHDNDQYNPFTSEQIYILPQLFHLELYNRVSMQHRFSKAWDNGDKSHYEAHSRCFSWFYCMDNGD